MSGITLETRVHFRRGRRSKKELRAGRERDSVSAGRIPRLDRLMALAIRFEDLVSDGVVAGYAELARLGHVTRARMTQITNLLHLAPDIQEAILFLLPCEMAISPKSALFSECSVCINKRRPPLLVQCGELSNSTRRIQESPVVRFQTELPHLQ